ncbi:hypothetical protein HanPSC8_Chr04g0185241 [Helianthus annuus]|nr:hypothetical protein HanPSC8_Chr04g0185241 [Helianthus annuus]
MTPLREFLAESRCFVFTEFGYLITIVASVVGWICIDCVVARWVCGGCSLDQTYVVVSSYCYKGE